MPTSVIEHIRTVVGDGVGLRDGELLGRYVDRRDESALAALVNRHGPMVWSVCRRLLGHHDAEDAFQATFIVLVRKASSIAHGETVGNWLYGVAHQTALQARRSAARRRAREVQVMEMAEAEAPQERWADLQALLDQELSRLPIHYRTVIILSDLEGRTRKEVAAQLGCPEGTVASRLVRARAMLAKRLTQRGLAMSGGALAAVLSQSAASAGLPASVLFSTIKAANLIAAGQAVISSKVTALAEGVLKTMLINKLKPALAVLVVVAMVGLIGYGMARGQQKGDAEQKQASEPKAPKDAAVNEKAEKDDATAWGKEVDGLQAGLLAEAATCRLGEKLKFTLKLRNVGKAEVSVTYSNPRYCAPQVTTDTGGQVRVYITQYWNLRGFQLPPIKMTIKPGETITLYNPEVAAESEDRAKLLGEMLVVGTSTICVAPGKYKIAFDGMIQSHSKLATGTVEFEVKEPAKPAAPIKDDVAWGKEADGLQAGIAGPNTVRIGENATFTLKLRNVGKAEATVTYSHSGYPPSVTTDSGGRVTVYMPPPYSGYSPPIKRTLKPGETITLYNPTVAVEPEGRAKLLIVKPYETSTICVAPGKYKITFGGMIPSHPKLATGTVEFEVREPVEAFTAWGKELSGRGLHMGKEVDGLQAGLGFRPGEKRAYSHGETVKLVVRVRNVGKKEVTFKYIPAYFFDRPPSVTDGEGKAAPQIRLPTDGHEGEYNPKELTLAPGKEVELAEVRIELRPASESGNKKVNTLYGTGKFQIHYERLMYSSGRSDIGSILSDLATGKLELEIKSAEKK